MPFDGRRSCLLCHEPRYATCSALLAHWLKHFFIISRCAVYVFGLKLELALGVAAPAVLNERSIVLAHPKVEVIIYTELWTQCTSCSNMIDSANLLRIDGTMVHNHACPRSNNMSVKLVTTCSFIGGNDKMLARTADGTLLARGAHCRRITWAPA